MNSETPAGPIEIPVLDDDLIREVLLRLPVKSLLKFRSVSKAWLSYISSPEFVKAHLSFSTNNNEYTHHLLMLNYSLALTGRYEYYFKDCCLRSLFDEPATEAFDVDCCIKSNWLFKKPIHSFSIVGSVNGIVCLAINNFILCLWNPSTRLMYRLPTSKPNLSWDGSQIYGFGYDQVCDDYKVAVIFCVGRSDLVQLRIYSLRSGSWTKGGCALDGVLLDVSGKLVSGKLHWPATTPGRNMYEGWNILSLDLVETKWNKVDQPSYGDGDVVLWLGVLGNDLSVFCNHKDENVDVWVMKEYGVKESWSKMFTIKYPYDPRVDYGFICFPSFMSHIGEILVYFGSNFMIYNPRSESFRCANVINFSDWREAGVYAESLVSPIPPKKCGENKA